MRNKHKIYEKLDSDIKTFLTQNGWQVYDWNSDKAFVYFAVNKLEDIPYKPKFLIEKDGQKMWTYYFWKGGYPFWESKFGQVTGFDWYKYQCMIGLTAETGIPCAILFDSEAQPEIIFRQLDQLPPPRHSRFNKKNCRRAFEPYAPLKAKCFQCWKENVNTFRMCKEQNKKVRTGLAVWMKEQFGHDTITQPSMFNN